MPMYTFHLFRQSGAPTTFDAVELPNDGATFVRSNCLLDEHPTCERVEVWDGERGVLAPRASSAASLDREPQQRWASTQVEPFT